MSGQLMHLRKPSFQLILYACISHLRDHVVLHVYSGYTDPNYKTMVYSAPLLCVREGHFWKRSPGLMLRKNRCMYIYSTPTPVTKRSILVIPIC